MSRSAFPRRMREEEGRGAKALRPFGKAMAIGKGKPDLQTLARTSPWLCKLIATEVRKRVEESLREGKTPDERKERLRELCRRHDAASRTEGDTRPLCARLGAVAGMIGSCWRELSARDLASLAGLVSEEEFAEIDFLISRIQWETSAIKNVLSLARKIS